jgi:hypothetical protein
MRARHCRACHSGAGQTGIQMIGSALNTASIDSGAAMESPTPSPQARPVRIPPAPSSGRRPKRLTGACSSFWKTDGAPRRSDPELIDGGSDRRRSFGSLRHFPDSSRRVVGTRDEPRAVKGIGRRVVRVAATGHRTARRAQTHSPGARLVPAGPTIVARSAGLIVVAGPRKLAVVNVGTA